MVSGSDDVCYRMDDSSARSYWDRKTVSRGLIRAIQQTKVQDNPPAVSDELPSGVCEQFGLVGLKKNYPYSSEYCNQKQVISVPVELKNGIGNKGFPIDQNV
ncbi:unnamed protein product [Protopolystoma xenopodis]|uniref:Uncharacterized protein n=1 Tax=Protopolystoma xenopodis TaxID=117903 RepID=A0A448WGL3_9PLAT|nr:unnamed protein product [Protopolystoma xenopodis]